MVNYGYDKEVLLPVDIQVPENAEIGSKVSLQAKVSWLMCEDQCIPGGANLSLEIPVGEHAEPTPLTYVFDKTDAQIPGEIAITQAKIDPRTHVIELSFSDMEPADHFFVFAEGDETIYYGADQPIVPTATGYSVFLKGTENVNPGDEFAGLFTSSGLGESWAASFSATLEEGMVVMPPARDRLLDNQSLWVVAGFALLGGLILNLMPCVFPVLSLKILGLVQNRKRSSLAIHGVGFLSGVLASMVILACALIALKEAGAAIGWGFQLQSPWFTAGLAFLFCAIGANLWGVFEFTLPNFGHGNNLKTQESSPFKESFLSGILAVIVASPCTAPFMGAALGYALSTSVIESLTIFVCLGLGMALPWTILAFFPILTAWLPKPGHWMIVFKKVMAIPMVLTAVWLIWILSQQVGTTSLILSLAGLAVLFIVLFLYGKVQLGAQKLKRYFAPLALTTAFLYVIGASNLFSPPIEPIKAPNAWSVQAVQDSLKEGKPVFVDFTASWCATCQANKFATLHSEKVQDTFKKLEFTVLEADWTNYDPEITKALEHFGRSGVPLYVIYNKDGSTDVLPEILTPGLVVEALDKADSKPELSEPPLAQMKLQRKVDNESDLFTKFSKFNPV